VSCVAIVVPTVFVVCFAVVLQNSLCLVYIVFVPQLGVSLGIIFLPHETPWK